MAKSEKKTNIDLALLKRMCEEMANIKKYVDFERSQPKSKVDTVIVAFKTIDTIATKLCEIARERKADIGLMEQCRDVIGSFIHDKDANVLPGAGLSTSDVLLLDEMFEQLDEVIEGYRAILKRKERDEKV